MRRLLMMGCLLALAAYAYSNLSDSGPSLELARTEVIRDTGELEVRYQRGSEFSRVLMIFGGNLDRKLHNSLSDFSLAGLGIEDASRIHQEYPDFHLCKSAGAPLAQGLTNTVSVLTETSSGFETVRQSLLLHHDRVANNGERTCIALQGDQLQLSSVIHKKSGTDVSQDIVPRMRGFHYYLVGRAEIVDCMSLL